MIKTFSRDDSSSQRPANFVRFNKGNPLHYKLAQQIFNWARILFSLLKTFSMDDKFSKTCKFLFGNKTKDPPLQNCLIQLTQLCFIYQDIKVFVTCTFGTLNSFSKFVMYKLNGFFNFFFLNDLR